MGRQWNTSVMNHRRGLTQDMVTHEINMPTPQQTTLDAPLHVDYNAYDDTVEPGEQMGLNDLDIGF